FRYCTVSVARDLLNGFFIAIYNRQRPINWLVRPTYRRSWLGTVDKRRSACRPVKWLDPMPQFIYTMKGLGKVHPPDAKVLEDIWLSFYFGAKIGVLGLNGAGKSSLLKIMSGEDTSFIGEAFPGEGISIGF